MKKILVVALTGILFSNSYAQDDKTFHAGLKVTPMLSWLKPDNEKKFENGGMTGQIGIGFVTEFKLAEKFWLSTGLGFDFDGGKINYIENPNDSIGYFLDDNEIVTYESENGEVTSIDTTASSDFIRLDSRKFNASYVTLPFIFKMKTKEIGMMRYYVQFGTRLGIKYKGRADDEGINLFSSNTPDLSDLNIDSEMSFMRVMINFGLGVEYNVSGSTHIVGGLDFNWGVTNAVNKRSEHLIQANQLSDNGKFISYDEQKFNQYNLALRIGVLF